LETIALVAGIQKQLSDPISFIILSLIIGLIHLNIAHILGMIRGIKEKDKGIIASKIGLFLVQIFGIPYIFNAMLNIQLFAISDAAYSAFAYPLIVGLVLIVLGAFMQMGALGAVFWIFDLTGILGDVMSYSRLAGVGLATFYLASSFNLLSDWVSATVSSVIPGFLGVAIAFVIGVVLLTMFHVFNLLLSSLAAFIHSLRLCFVEFLLKFYEGGGRAYAPFHLKLRKEVIVGKKS
jgi:V/A-type H+-transporting ATPase subunit I